MAQRVRLFSMSTRVYCIPRPCQRVNVVNAHIRVTKYPGLYVAQLPDLRTGIGRAIREDMTDILYMLLGGVLVVFGVMAAALADRVRGIKQAGWWAGDSRDAVAAIPTTPPRVRLESIPSIPSAAEQDVIAALVASGYKKAAATDAARGCTAADRATIEGWTAAALRRAGKGVLS
jgi:hypothetical protein